LKARKASKKRQNAMQEDEHKEFITGKTHEFYMYETGKHKHSERRVRTKFKSP
jgi:hypothetical protein